MFILDNDPVIDRALKRVKADFDDDVSIPNKRKSLLKFGANNDIQANVAEDVLELQGAEVSETLQSSNSIDSIVSNDASFTGQVIVEGHTISGSDLTFVRQTATLNGQTPVSLTTPLARVTRLENDSNQTIGTGTSSDLVYVYRSVGTTVTLGVPQTNANIHIVMSGFCNRSKKCQTAISKNDYWFITSLYAGVLRKTASSVDFFLKVAYEGKVFHTEIEFSAYSSNQPTVITLPEAIIVPPNSDVKITAVSSTANTAVFAGMNGPLGIKTNT